MLSLVAKRPYPYVVNKPNSLPFFQFLLILLSFPLLFSSCEKLKSLSTGLELKTEMQKYSYSMGSLITSDVKKIVPIIDGKAFSKGMEHKLNEQKTLLSMKEMFSTQKKINEQKMKMLAKQKQAKSATTNTQGANKKMDGKMFLEENKKKAGVKVTPSGLQYKVVQEGTGKSPISTDVVEVHYKGTLIDGTEFDSSYKRQATASFPLNRVIQGWTEGLQLMKEGATYEFYIPSQLAYGERGAGSSIPPNATLIFQVELIKVK